MFKSITILLYIIFAAQVLQADTRINLIGTFPLSGGITDVWSYSDTINSKEYAIVGSYNGIWIIDVTDAGSPELVINMQEVPAFDFKIWKNYLYTVTGAPGTNQGMIIDLSSISAPVIAGYFNSAHNIYITENGYLLAEIPGLKIYNLNDNPLSPRLVFNSKDSEGHDAALIGNRLYDFHGRDGTNIYDVSFGDSLIINLIGSINDPTISYHHSGWPSEDGNTLFICDELAVNPFPDVTAWDITDPANPKRIGGYIDSNATIHNLYVIDELAYTSHYTSGFKVLDVSDPANITVAAHFDTNPFSGDGFSGAFGVYPFSSSGNIFVSDDTGLYIFKVQNDATPVQDNNSVKMYELHQNYPNPFNPSTIIKYNITEPQHVSLKVFSTLGEEIKTLADGYQDAGEKIVEWDGTDNNGNKIAQGVYLYTLMAGEYKSTRKMILMK